MMRRSVVSAVCMGAMAMAGGGCSTVRSMFALDQPSAKNPPIENPFDNFYAAQKARDENIILRTKKGDRAVEVELPGSNADMTDFVVPVSPAFTDTGSGGSAGRGLASVDDDSAGPGGDQYKERKTSMTDREITSTLPQGLPEDAGERREIESGLGVVPVENGVPERDESYLAAVDHLKALYKGARYEKALLEVDDLIHSYPTDPRLYEMRGTLLERVGRLDLAIKSWNQALRFDPSNQSLQRFIERKQQKRSLASP